MGIDESGNLIIIENKLDDSGRDVVWQALKYASYCSGLTKNDVREIFQSYLDNLGKRESAENLICDFLGIDDYNEIEINNDDQRVIMVSANFRKEVTSTVMWLLDHNIKIKCIKVTPYELEGKVLLDTEQIIPIVDAEEYLIKIVKKKQEELNNKSKKQIRSIVLNNFWVYFLNRMNERSELFKNVSPSKDNWISCGSGHSGMGYNFVVTGNHVRVELGINRGQQKENKELFDKIYNHKAKIDESFGNGLDWQRLDTGKSCRIAFYLDRVSVFNEEDWKDITEFLIENMIKLEKSLKNVLPVL